MPDDGGCFFVVLFVLVGALAFFLFLRDEQYANKALGQCQEACARLQPAESRIVEGACLCKVDTTWVHVEPLSWRK